ncbi:MAG: hypothetical protein ACOYXT_12620 [Bacteroidota bacterium]
MEIFIVIFASLIIPLAVISILVLVGRRLAKETRQKDQLVATMENIIEMKNKMIKQLKSLNPF